MEIKFIKKSATHQKCIRPAALVYEDTGEKQIVRVRGIDGIEREEERPVKQQVLREARYAEETIEQKIYQVDDGVDIHEFSSLSSAEEFIRG